jgi:tetrahydromethanopterin S-methyltransferase subunit B
MLDKPDFSYLPSQLDPAVEFRTQVFRQFHAGSERMAKLEQATEHNSQALDAATKEIQAQREDTAEMIELFKAMKGGFKVLGWLGLLAKWAVAISAGVGLLMKLTGWSWPGR